MDEKPVFPTKRTHQFVRTLFFKNRLQFGGQNMSNFSLVKIRGEKIYISSPELSLDGYKVCYAMKKGKIALYII